MSRLFTLLSISPRFILSFRPTIFPPSKRKNSRFTLFITRFHADQIPPSIENTNRANVFLGYINLIAVGSRRDDAAVGFITNYDRK